MREIYFLSIVVLTAVGSSVTTMYAKPLLARIKRLLTRFKRNKLSLLQRIDLLERRVDLHTNKDGVYLNKFDELEELLKKRDKGRKEMVRREVRDYLNELKNG